MAAQNAEEEQKLDVSDDAGALYGLRGVEILPEVDYAAEQAKAALNDSEVARQLQE